jgi:hypothetical protein
MIKQLLWGILLNIALISSLSAQYTGGVDTGYRPYDEFNDGLDSSFYLPCTYVNGCKVFTDALPGNDPP